MIIAFSSIHVLFRYALGEYLWTSIIITIIVVVSCSRNVEILVIKSNKITICINSEAMIFVTRNDFFF